MPPFNAIAKAIFEAAEGVDASQTLADGKNFNYPAKEAFDLLFPPRNDAIVKLVDF